jgi:SAM-dependent methyltransferase
LKELSHFNRKEFSQFALAVLMGSFAQGCTPSPPSAQEVPSVIHESSVAEFEVLVNEYEDPDRGDWQNPQLVVNTMGDLSDKVVADIGAGTGYFTFRLARHARKVIAIDIDERFLQYIDERKYDGGDGRLAPIETRLSEKDDPKLEDGEADIILLVNTWCFIPDRLGYLTKLRKGLASDGRIVIVDFPPGEEAIGPPMALRLSVEQVQRELEQGGFRVVGMDTQSLEFQYIIIAE